MIYIEWYADTTLIKSLLPNIRKCEYAHCGNKAEVIKQLRKRHSGRGHIGLIDADPGSAPPSYFYEYAI